MGQLSDSVHLICWTPFLVCWAFLCCWIWGLWDDSLWEWIKHSLESLTLHSSAVMWVVSVQGIKKRARQAWGGWGAAAGRRKGTVQISGSGEGKETFLPNEGWQQQAKGCWRFDRQQGSAGTWGVGAALSPAQLMSQILPCKKVSSLFWAAGARGQQVSASQGEGLGSAIDEDKNKIIKIFLRIASAPIHLQLGKKDLPQSWVSKTSSCPSVNPFP